MQPLIFILTQGSAGERLYWLSIQTLGLTQLVYVIPILVFAYRTGRKQLAFSVVLAASLTFLLAAACGVAMRN